jgi:hypothetical protein
MPFFYTFVFLIFVPSLIFSTSPTTKQASPISGYVDTIDGLVKNNKNPFLVKFLKDNDRWVSLSNTMADYKDDNVQRVLEDILGNTFCRTRPDCMVEVDVDVDSSGHKELSDFLESLRDSQRSDEGVEAEYVNLLRKLSLILENYDKLLI